LSIYVNFITHILELIMIQVFMAVLLENSNFIQRYIFGLF